MSISIVVCHHRGDLYKKTVESLLKSKVLTFDIVIMTSDPELEEYPGCRVHYFTGGPAQKRNVALSYCLGSFIGFFDDDVVVSPYAVYELWSHLVRNPELGMVFGKLLKMDDGVTFDEAGSFLTPFGFLWARGDRVKDEGQFDKEEFVLAGKSAACMIRRNAMEAVGGFDNEFGILGEETDLAWRLWIAGYDVAYVPRSVTLHAFGTPLKPADFYTKTRVYYNGCRNYITMLLKCLQGSSLLRILPIHILLWIGCSFGMLFRGRFEEFSLIWKGIFYPLWHIRYVLRKRLKVKKIRIRYDDTLFAIFMRWPGWRYYLTRFFRYIKSGVHG